MDTDKRLEELFRAQRAPREPEPRAAERRICIRFEMGAQIFVANIENVREVVEQAVVVPYPEQVPGHRGVISLRGEILPVVGEVPRRVSSDARRLLVLEFTPGVPFCVEAHGIRKTTIDHAHAPGETVLVDGKAAILAEERHFLAA